MTDMTALRARKREPVPELSDTVTKPSGAVWIITLRRSRRQPGVVRPRRGDYGMLEEGLKQWLQARAAAEHRTLTNFIEKVLADYRNNHRNASNKH
jgi:hypothetical protein